MFHRVFDYKILPAKDKMFRFALRMLGNKEDARDAIQDVLMKLWENKERMEEVENPEAWCMQITKNLCLDRLKAQKVREVAARRISQENGNETQQTPYNRTEQKDHLEYV